MAAQKRTRDDNEEQKAVTDAEVDEFYAILRRIRVAVKYFKQGNDEGRKLTAIGSLERKSNGNVEGNGVKGNGKREDVDGVEENAGLDLNASPAPDDDPA